MALERFEKDMDIILALDDEPNDVGGLSADDLKAKFDEGGKAIKEYLNSVLVPHVENISGSYEAAKAAGYDGTEEQFYRDLADVQNVANKADKSQMNYFTLYAADWRGEAAPYTYTLSVAGVTATSNQEILPALDITDAELKAMQAANIQDGGQQNNAIVLKAFGEKPKINLPIRVIKRGD